ncbi:6-phosphogluconolactonase [Roseovarius sp. HI0049]|nr:6-phosphogluconolactonase [Roseovarius sp. HI0049]
MNFVDYPDDELMAVHLANTLAGELTAALEHKERVLFVVPGGTTPGPVFDSLCDSDLDWARVDVLPSDERWLPEVHVRSNSRLIRERLLTGRAEKANFLPLYRKSGTPEDVLEEVEETISPSLPINVCLLGMGSDMHTASLFPGADNLEQALDRYAPVLVPMRAPDVPEPRVTLSARVLRDALTLHVVITGQAKKAALDRAGSLEPMKAPVAAILEEATVHWAP